MQVEAADEIAQGMQQIVYVSQCGWCYLFQEFSGKPESRSIDKLGQTSANVRLESRPNAEKDDWKVINSVLAVGIRHEDGFKLGMEALHHSVSSWMISGCSHGLATQEAAQFEEKR